MKTRTDEQKKILEMKGTGSESYQLKNNQRGHRIHILRTNCKINK